MTTTTGPADGYEGQAGWPTRSQPGGTAPAPAGPPGAGQASPGQVLDWEGVKDRLNVLRHRWDLGIIANLAGPEPLTPSDLLEVINRQARRFELIPQVLSLRLRALEKAGYIGHEDLSRIPTLRVFYLMPAGHRLLAELACLPRQPAGPRLPATRRETG